MSVRVVAVSDTHGLHRKLDVPLGDLFVHAGDFTNFGRKEENKDFLDWCSELPHKEKMVLFGNHDKHRWVREDQNREEFYRKSYPNIRFMIHDEVELFGLRWFGCASTVNYGKHPISEGPDKCDVLLTHSPPYGILDQVPREKSAFDPPNTQPFESIGDKEILKYMQRARPQLSLFGHTHETRGQSIELNGTKFYNLAVCDYNPITGEKNLVGGCTVIDL